MKEIQVQDKTYFFVEIPKSNKDFTDFYISEAGNLFGVSSYGEKQQCDLYLNLINYNVISTTKDITEEQRLSIIEEHPHSAEYWKFAMMPLYLIYGKKQLIGKYTRFNNGTENDEKSLQSLIQANGLDVSKNYLLLQKL
jgi:hypothetical protein